MNLSQNYTKSTASFTVASRISPNYVVSCCQETLESVVMTMESYNAIPTRRIQYLANKLMHHTKMKVIESNVRNSNMVTSDVFNILGTMVLHTFVLLAFIQITGSGTPSRGQGLADT